MKHFLSCGYLNVVADNLIEIVVDKAAIIDVEQYYEFIEVINTSFNNSYGILLNRIHHFNFTPECIKLFANNDDVVAIASVRFFDAETPDILSLVTNTYAEEINFRFFEGLKLGRTKAITWLEHELSKLNSNA